jgi:hypothetical protein
MDLLSHAAIFFGGFCLGAITCLVWEFKEVMKHYVQMYIEGCEPIKKENVMHKKNKENEKRKKTKIYEFSDDKKGKQS